MAEGGAQPSGEAEITEFLTKMDDFVPTVCPPLLLPPLAHAVSLITDTGRDHGLLPQPNRLPVLGPANVPLDSPLARPTMNNHRCPAQKTHRRPGRPEIHC